MASPLRTHFTAAMTVSSITPNNDAQLPPLIRAHADHNDHNQKCGQEESQAGSVIGPFFLTSEPLRTVIASLQCPAFDDWVRCLTLVTVLTLTVSFVVRKPQSVFRWKNGPLRSLMCNPACTPRLPLIAALYVRA